MKTVKLDYKAICEELNRQKKSMRWLSNEIGRSDGYFAGMMRNEADVKENIEALISRTLGYEPGDFTLTDYHKEKPKDEIERNMVFIEKLYAGQNNIMVKLDVMARQINAMQQNMKLLEREQMAKRRYDEMNDHLEFIRGKSNTSVIQIEKLREMLADLDSRNLDDQNQIIDEIAKLLEAKTVITKGSAKGKAYELLEELIVDQNGVEQARIFEEADKRNISRKHILMAKNEMGIRVTTRGIGANGVKYWYKE